MKTGVKLMTGKRVCPTQPESAPSNPGSLVFVIKGYPASAAPGPSRRQQGESGSETSTFLGLLGPPLRAGLLQLPGASGPQQTGRRANPVPESSEHA